eukprot:Gb_31353 [translate_table: standard]
MPTKDPKVSSEASVLLRPVITIAREASFTYGSIRRMLVDAHIFSFVVGRALVTDIEKLRNISQSGSLDVGEILKFFTEVPKDGISPGSNLLYALESIVSPPLDVQPLLDSGILCCLIHILHAFLTPSSSPSQDSGSKADSTISPNRARDGDNRQAHRLEVLAQMHESVPFQILCHCMYQFLQAVQLRSSMVEGSIVHIMKALSSHPVAAQSLIEDDSFQLLFQMVANGSSNIVLGLKSGTLPLHVIQLHRHAMQILGLLLVNDNGSTAKYIHARHLVICDLEFVACLSSGINNFVVGFLVGQHSIYDKDSTTLIGSKQKTHPREVGDFSNYNGFSVTL